MKQKMDTKSMVLLALFSAVVVVMANVPFLGYVPIGPIRATTLHIPVIIGSFLLGAKKGAILGFIFGLTSFFANTFSPTITSFVFTPFYSAGGIEGNGWSLVICFLPRILIGILPAFLANGTAFLKEKKDKPLFFAVIAFFVSLLHTILVMGLIYLLFGEQYAAAKQMTINLLWGSIIYIIGVNGVIEAFCAGFFSASVPTLQHLQKKIIKA